MTSFRAFLVALLALAFLGPSLAALAAPLPPSAALVDWSALVSCDGLLPRDLDFVDPADPSVRVHVDTFCADEATAGGPIVGAMTDCARTTYVALGYRWAVPYVARFNASSSGLGDAGVQAAFQAGLDTWDDATLAEVGGVVTQGGRGSDAGLGDRQNQFGWKALGSGTIAVTTTWYLPAQGLAIESDAAYSTAFTWSLSGEAGKMDLQHIATHELGHTLGLADLYDSADSCLTMYGYGSTGQTHARTLGDGDILGVKAVYGA